MSQSAIMFNPPVKHALVKIVSVKITLLLLLSCLCGNSLAQLPAGKFRWTDPAGLASVVMEFNGNRFKHVVYGDIDSLFGIGNFMLEKEKLTLIYDECKNPGASRTSIEITSEHNNKNTILEFRVRDAQNGGKPFPNAILIFRHDAHEVFSTYTDASGLVKMNLPNTESINSVEVVVLGYDPLNIKLRDLEGKSAVIDCLLAVPQQKYMSPGRKEHVFKAVSNDQFVISLGSAVHRFSRVE